MKRYRYIGRNRRNPRGLSIPNGATALGQIIHGQFKVQLDGYRVVQKKIGDEQYPYWRYVPEALVFWRGKLLGDWSHRWHATLPWHWVEIK
jgi:hypothetical protein